MSDVRTRNAVIKSARITKDDHNLLTVWLDLDYGGTGQGFGGYTLYLPESYSHHKDSLKANYAGHFIWRVMEVAGAEHWDAVPGQTIRVKQEITGVHAIGHIVKDDWFCPSKDFEAMKPTSEAMRETKCRLSHGTVHSRVERGWSLEDAVTRAAR